MSVMMQISNDGNEVYVLKTLLNSKVDESKFINKAKVIDSTAFIKSMPMKYRGVMIERINRVIDLHQMKLSKFGSITHSDRILNLTSTAIYTGGRIFYEDYGTEEIYHQTQDAIDYSKKYYGEDFMNRYGEKLLQENFLYFSDKKRISEEEYNKLMKEYESLTSIITINNKNINLNKSKNR
jgi:hypothetical protein